MAVSMLVGCGNGGESGKQSADADKSSSKNVTLDFWTIDLKATFGDFFNDLISKYEEENKGVKINWTDIPYADVQSKLVAAVDVSYSGEIPAGGVQVPFKVPGAKKGDMVYVLHRQPNAPYTWEVVGSGVLGDDLTVTGTFTSFSPVAFMVVDAADVAATAVKAPKTGEF